MGSSGKEVTGLEGLRVLELGELVSASFAAKMMGDLGADVVKVETPGGDRARRRLGHDREGAMRREIGT